MFTATYTVVSHTAHAATVMHRSPKRAVELARRAAWAKYETAPYTPWACDYLVLRSPKGEIISNGFAD